jgi:hypothetical protein
VPDPLRTVWDALETQGWQPRGPEHDFHANCPGHGGDSGNLHVSEGWDRRVLLYCHSARCSAKVIVDALGLGLADLYPAGHEYARTIQMQAEPVQHRNTKRVMDLLAKLAEVGEPWQVMVSTHCQFCGGPGAWYRVGSEEKEPHLDCPDGCSSRAYTQGLEGKIQLARAEAEVTRRGKRALQR